VAARIQGRICRVVAVRVWVGIMWISSRRVQGVGRRESSVSPQQRSRCSRIRQSRRRRVQLVGQFHAQLRVPNASWIAVVVAFSELAIGIGLAFGFLTRIAALASLALLFTYIMSGTASVCGFYALCAIIVLATWRTSTWIGVDGIIAGYKQRRHHVVPVEVVAVVTPVPELVSVG